MSRRVRFATSFLEDLEGQLSWLLAHAASDRVDQLEEAVDEAVLLLGQFPLAGPVERSDGSGTLRKLILRKLPYVLWYTVDAEAAGDVWFLRLFHCRQDRPRPPGPKRPRSPRKK